MKMWGVMSLTPKTTKNEIVPQARHKAVKHPINAKT